MAKDKKKETAAKAETSEKKTHNMRTKEERKAALEAKIAFHREKIAKLEDDIKALDKPKSGRKSAKTKKFETMIAEGKLTLEEAIELGYKAPKTEE